MPLQQDPFRGRSGQQVVLVSGGAPLRDPAMEERMAQMKAVVIMLVKTTRRWWFLKLDHLTDLQEEQRIAV